MGEVAVSSEEDMDLELEFLEKEEDEQKKKSPQEGSVSVVRWEGFLPRMVVRVLLVEADESTRHIISALLRKCSYRVAAVPDGLKAWEVLKRKANKIDLILTEADLPSISGYALLTLIMEHETCKNIPIIMMSSQDSISMVYKCMLRGAADYLVKPIRINELKNLWQHVWRRHSQLVNGALGSKNGTDAAQEMEATAENNAVSYHSDGSKDCSQRQEGIFKKGSDAQSSCTKEDLEVGRDKCPDFRENPLIHKTVSPSPDRNVQNGGVGQRGYREVVNHHNDVFENAEAVGNYSREATNFIGAFADKLNGHFGTSPVNNAPCEYESSQLDLSWQRFHLSGSENYTNEKHILNHSDASAFSRYAYKPIQLTRPTVVSLSNPRDGKIKIGEHLSDEMNCNNSDAEEAEPSHLGSKLLMPVACKDQIDVTFPCSQRQSVLGGHVQKMDCNKTHRHFSSPSDQSDCNSSLGNACASQLNWSGSICESGLEEGFVARTANPQLSSPREAALAKFRLKRKERCFMKKVRYESRKKLAEQRPRVKGQFVRNIPSIPAPVKCETSCGNSNGG